MKKQILILVCAVAFFGAGCATTNRRPLTADIKNDHIHWDGDFFGLTVSSMDEPEKTIYEEGAIWQPLLIEALKDDSKFVAAHVLLTQTSHIRYNVSGTEWNHLRVELYAD